ncbi:MAG: protein kinase [bacterium]|nr:protein kinase [Myxococcales bacterium]MCB9553047.1 protein kinase [Myxococcales bacterium]
MDTLSDTRLGDYRLTRVIAAGGMAAVYEGKHEPTGRPVAIKVLARKLQNRRDPLARILQEGRVICSLLHEHIVRVFDYGTAEEGIGFVVMELLKGVTLAEELGRRGPLPAERAAFIGRQVCAGLEAAHARGVYHRDIKPANIMLVEGQRHSDFVKLLDFGIAKLDADDPAKLAATATGMTLGTPQYMSPEQARADTIDARSDIYQLGLVLYEILTGRPTFSDRNPVTLMGKHLTEKPESIRDQRPEVSEEMEAVIMRCLEKQPAARYQTARELQAALDRIAADDAAISRVGTAMPATGPLPGGVVGGNLRLPTLGNPADLERYARNLSEVLDQLWPEGVPDELQRIQDELWSLTDDQARVGTDLAVARADADALAQELEARLRPLEKAIEALGEEQNRFEARMTAAQAEEGRVMARLRALDAEYAAIYTEIEQHQAALYGRGHVTGGPVDFRELFREDIAARLDQLEGIFDRRTEQSERLTAVRHQMAGMLPRLVDIEQQLYELKKSRLSLETERASTLARMEFTVTDLDNQHKDLERALEHRYLQLGLAFRRAVSTLIDARTRR